MTRRTEGRKRKKDGKEREGDAFYGPVPNRLKVSLPLAWGTVFGVDGSVGRRRLAAEEAREELRCGLQLLDRGGARGGSLLIA